MSRCTAASRPRSLSDPARRRLVRVRWAHAGFLAPFLAFALACRARATPLPDECFLDELGRASFTLFRDESQPQTGLVPDAVRADGSPSERVASIAGTGFGLAALAIADERGWLAHAETARRTRLTLRFLADHVAQEHGFFYHFVTLDAGARCWRSEVSSVDTAWLLCGALTARQQFDDPEIRALATRLYERVDWPWMLNGRRTLCQGWNPEAGFTRYRWEGYSEHLALYLLGLGSPTHPLPAACWTAWRREPVGTHAGYTFLECPPLFAHQYAQAFIDFRGRRDAFADYWRNSVFATLAQRDMCARLRPEFPQFSGTLWGITSSEATNGYRAWGGPPRTVATNTLDGTLVPCAPGGSIPFAPEACIEALRSMRARFGDRIWGRYGFADAFNPQSGWVAPDVLSIDAGITLLMTENQRSGFVWDRFMRNREIRTAMARAGFRETDRALPDVDRQYLGQLAREAWCSVEPRATAAGDAGLLLTATVAAQDLGFIDAAQARQRIARVLDALTNGSGAGIAPPPSACEAGRLAAGLIVAGEACPELRDTCARHLGAIPWRTLFPGQAPAAGSLGSEIRLSVFLAIACGALPPSAWESLGRELESRQHTHVLKSGPTGGGLVEAYLPGLWLDERGTLFGQSAQNRAYAEMSEAAAQGRAAWGSSDGSERPGVELAPCASALALADFPAAAVANLRTLEALGARVPGRGFAGCFDGATRHSLRDATPAERALFFLGVAADLEDRGVRRVFQQAQTVQRGRALIDDYALPSQGASNAVFTLHEHRYDAPRRATAYHLSQKVVSPDWHLLDAESRESVADGDGLISMRFAFSWDLTNLVFTAEVQDPDVINDGPSPLLYKQDCVELFVNPANDGLVWWRTNDFQFGFAVTNRSWEWFGARNLQQVRVESTPGGYRVEAGIPWRLLGLSPHPGLTIGVSPALNSVSRAEEPAVLLNWRWRRLPGHFGLGEVTLEGP